jgi:hypothetical protein
MHCNHTSRRLRQRIGRPRTDAPQATEPAVQRPLPAGLVQQLACPITDMNEVERLLAHLYCARARGYF